MRNRNKPKWNSLKQWNLALTNDETLAAGPCHCGPALHPWRLLPPPLKAPPPPGFQLGAQSFFGCHLPFSFPISSPPPPLPPSSFLLPPSVPPPPPTHQKFHQFSPSEVATVAIVANAANGDPVPGFWSGILYLPVTGNLKESPNIPENHQESRKIPKNSENLRKKSGIPKNPWRIAKKLLKNLIESQQFSKNLQRIFRDSSQNPQKSPKSPQNP